MSKVFSAHADGQLIHDRSKETSMTTLSGDIHDLFEGPNIAHVATLLPDGTPHTVPVWIGLEADKIAILTSPRSQKARNLDRDPRVAISITDRDQPTAMATIRGRVTDTIRDEPAWEIIDRISHKYTGQPYPLREDRIVFMIEVDHAFAHTFG